MKTYLLCTTTCGKTEKIQASAIGRISRIPPCGCKHMKDAKMEIEYGTWTGESVIVYAREPLEELRWVVDAAPGA